MEEFSEKQVNGAAVILDENSKLVVAPLHEETKIQGEQSSAQIANAHANGPAIGNFEGDIESTGDQPASHQAQAANQRATELLARHKATQPAEKSAGPIVAVAAVVVMLGLLLFVLLYR